jgi:uncharacterized membrane protein YkgB
MTTLLTIIVLATFGVLITIGFVKFLNAETNEIKSEVNNL